MRNMLKRAAVGVGAMAMLGGIMATPASAATPAGICGAGYYELNHHAVGAYATVHVLYKSDGHNCAVTTLNNPDGKKHLLGAYLQVQGSPVVKDVNDYTTYAGPVRVYAPSKCVQWSGVSGLDDGTFVSGWDFCD